MSYKALYRKYRPDTFSDVVGQEHITETIKSQLDSGKIFHAYLFTGTRGTGKTSCAKILAKAINCLSPIGGDPCNECESCIAVDNEDVTDIVEMDAASNNGVEYIRDLREQINFTPATLKYRVYIIDEVHMLSIGAFNALLKTLEEPPAHVVFILATTEVHKLPATILSRCQRFDFKRIDAKKIAQRIKYIADNESFTVTDDAADMIAAVADGGMRDALSTLDLCVSADTSITADTVAKVCGMAGNEYLISMADAIKKNDCEYALILLDKLYRSSVDMVRLLGDLILHYRNLMIIKTVRGGQRPIVCSSEHMKNLEAQAESYDIRDIMSTLSLLQGAATNMQNGNRRTEMELTLIKLCSPKLRSDIDSLERRIAALENSAIIHAQFEQSVKTEATTPIVRKKVEINGNTPVISEVAPPEPEEEAIPPIEDIGVDIPETTTPEPASVAPADGQVDNMVWQEILNKLSMSAPLLSGILANSAAYIQGDFLLIDSQNSQFAELMNAKNGIYREKLRNAVESVLSRTYKLGPYKKAVTDSKDDPLMSLKEKLKNLEVPRSTDI